MYNPDPAACPALPPAILEMCEGLDTDAVGEEAIAALGGVPAAQVTVAHIAGCPAKLLGVMDALEADPRMFELVKLVAWGGFLTGWTLRTSEVAQENLHRHHAAQAATGGEPS